MFQNHTGIMARRLLVNWRITPHAAQAALPPNVRPALINGYAVAGLCLVRLEQLRPTGLPAILGLSSENVAARIGIEFDSPTGTQKSVFIFHRDTASPVNYALAHHIGFGLHNYAPIHVTEKKTRLQIKMKGTWQSFNVDLSDTQRHPGNSAFSSLDNAKDFFRGSEVGYSPSKIPNLYHGAKLRLHSWQLDPMIIHHAYSSFIDALFPNAATLDSAFVMRNIPHTWTRVNSIRFASSAKIPQTQVQQAA
jgi:hypothetical protein